MYRWIPYAFVRISILYGSGVVIGISFADRIDTRINIIITSGFTIAFLLCVFINCGRTLTAGLFAATSLFSAGCLNVLLSDESRERYHLTNVNGNVTAFQAIIDAAAQERPKTWKYEIAVQQVLIGENWTVASSRAILYVRKDSLIRPYRYGDVVLVSAPLIRIPPPQNPGEFDLQAYQKNRQVYFQSTVAPSKIQRLSFHPPNQMIGMAITARLWAEGVIEKFVQGDRESAIASAFVLGVTDGLDNDLISAYAATGAMHVLSVSGLHVGIVYWLLLLLFKPFSSQHVRWQLLVLSLIVLWSYAFITGISASVLRAVVMFSFASIARASNYRIIIYNILAATVFILLVIDPFMIMSVGFQLSFIAVVGIVAIQPGLYQLWEPHRWLWDEVWKVVTVSVAAQVATLPLCLLYFHQFPNYFLLSNLFIVPGSFAVLLLGIGLLLVSPLDSVAKLTGRILELLIDFLNQLIFLVEKLPGSVIENIFITSLQCLVLSAVVITIVVWIGRRSGSLLVVVLSLIATFGMTSWVYTVNLNTPTVTVYSTRGTTAVDLISEYVTYYIGSPDLKYDRRQVVPNRVSHRAADNVMNLTGQTVFPGCDLFVWHGYNIVRVYGEIPELEGPLQADLVIFSENAVRDLRRASDLIVAKRYVVDGSNDLKVGQQLIEQAAGLHFLLHSVLHQGAMQLNFEYGTH
ncbi:ComEC/Rec2 family competence protein [Chryseolinea sp. T2]|uniref:ComEC/Rec2 family competence protein n=1 Tax=Chryseolinea sp. T2 TaxID=3129255 RepID=UPI003077A285